MRVSIQDCEEGMKRDRYKKPFVAEAETSTIRRWIRAGNRKTLLKSWTDELEGGEPSSAGGCRG